MSYHVGKIDFFVIFLQGAYRCPAMAQVRLICSDMGVVGVSFM